MLSAPFNGDLKNGLRINLRGLLYQALFWLPSEVFTPPGWIALTEIFSVDSLIDRYLVKSKFASFDCPYGFKPCPKLFLKFISSHCISFTNEWAADETFTILVSFAPFSLWRSRLVKRKYPRWFTANVFSMPLLVSWYEVFTTPALLISTSISPHKPLTSSAHFLMESWFEKSQYTEWTRVSGDRALISAWSSSARSWFR